MYRKNHSVLSSFWAMVLFSCAAACFAISAHAQVSPGFQSGSFQYLNEVLTSNQITSTRVANALASGSPPKYFTLGVTTTATGFAVALQGSLDNSNWSTIAVTTSALGLISSILPKPMLYFRLQATTIAANTSVTATAIGTP